MRRDAIQKLQSISIETQIKFFTEAASAIVPRDLKGQTEGRWYCSGEGFNRKILNALKKAGHGQKIWVSDGANGYRIYFDDALIYLAAKNCSEC
ncbi:hypothetical protein [Pseudaestuariivita rosea]|uniref:hypothetical protein n=1 Tax=Pseudaestuariivita rosea TaxID=2763263 RepID=UPI001ABA27B5|nr:hypothetical protein [Pseudaestuariivita rosea]